jgi:NitT/TauT family transport system substrate-binding protein
MITRRNAMLGAMAMPLVLRAGTASAQTAKISVGHVTASDFVPMVVGPEKGLFAKNGVEVTPVKLPIIVHVPPGLVSGSIHIGTATIPLLLQAVDGGLDLVLVAGAARHTKDKSKIGLAVRSEFNFQNPGDLKGKKIAVAGFNSTMDILLKKWLKDRGVDIKSVQFVEAAFPQMSDMLKSGTVDAATVTEPVRGRIVQSGSGKIASEYVADVNPDLLMVSYIATRKWAEANRSTVDGFRKGLDETNKWIAANWEEGSKIEQKNFGFTSPTPPVNLTVEAKAADLVPYIEIGKELGLYNSKLDPEKLIWK